MFMTNNSSGHQNFSQYGVAPFSKSNFDDNEIVLFIIWSFVGVVLGIQIIAMTAVLIWATLDCCRTIAFRAKTLNRKYFPKKGKVEVTKSDIYEPIFMNNTAPQQGSIEKLYHGQDDPDIS